MNKRGFSSISPERRREIASMGGKAVPREKRSFSQDRELASAAGRKGGSAIRPENRSFSKNRKLAAEAGRKGGSVCKDSGKLATVATKPLDSAPNGNARSTSGTRDSNATTAVPGEAIPKGS